MFLGLGIFKLIQTFWGVAAILGLGGYSLYAAAQPSENDASSSSSTRSGGVSQAYVMPTISLTPRPTPIGGFPTPSPLTIFLACDGPDGDSARYYVSAPGGYVVLRIDTDRDVVAALLTGQPTRFPTNGIQVQTPCVRSRIRAGTFP